MLFLRTGNKHFDIEIHKVTRITESNTSEFRFAAFNTLSHARFYPKGSVDGYISDSTFGHMLKAAPPCIGQVALKFSF